MLQGGNERLKTILSNETITEINVNPQILHFGSQKLVYNSDSKIAKTVIDSPFIKAGHILWKSKISEFGSPGIGLNEDLIKFVLERSAILIVYVADPGEDYWILPHELAHFIKNYNSDYRVATNPEKFVKVIPWKIFRRFIHHGSV